MRETGGWRERFESYALLWGLLLVVGVLSILPLARLLVEGVAPPGEPVAAPIARVALERRHVDRDAAQPGDRASAEPFSRSRSAEWSRWSSR